MPLNIPVLLGVAPDVDSPPLLERVNCSRSFCTLLLKYSLKPCSGSLVRPRPDGFGEASLVGELFEACVSLAASSEFPDALGSTRGEV